MLMDSAIGAIEFFLVWSERFHQFLSIDQLIEMRIFALKAQKKFSTVMDGVGEVISQKLVTLSGLIDRAYRAATCAKPGVKSYVATLPENDSVRVAFAQRKAERKAERERIRQEEEARRREEEERERLEFEALNKELAEMEMARGGEDGERIGGDVSESKESNDIAETTTPGDVQKEEKSNLPTLSSGYKPAVFGLNFDDTESEVSERTEKIKDDIEGDIDKVMDESMKEDEKKDWVEKDDTADDISILSHLSADVVENGGNLEEVKTDNVSKIPYSSSILPDNFDFWGDPKPLHDDLLLLHTSEIAKQWTLIDQKMFASIPLSQFLEMKWSEPRHFARAVEIRRFIDRFNALSMWASMCVLLANAKSSAKFELARAREQGIPDQIMKDAQNFDDGDLEVRHDLICA